jgi:hypothetical protein
MASVSESALYARPLALLIPLDLHPHAGVFLAIVGRLLDALKHRLRVVFSNGLSWVAANISTIVVYLDALDLPTYVRNKIRPIPRRYAHGLPFLTGCGRRLLKISPRAAPSRFTSKFIKFNIPSIPHHDEPITDAPDVIGLNAHEVYDTVSIRVILHVLNGIPPRLGRS